MSRPAYVLAIAMAGLIAVGCTAAAPVPSPDALATGTPSSASPTAAGASAVPTLSPTAAPTAAAPTAAAPTAASTPPAAGAPTEDPLTPHQFPDLEARIPNSVAGLAIQKASFGADFGEGALSADFQAAVEQVGMTVTDVQLATAGPPVDSDRDLSIVAFKVGGADSAVFLQALRTISEANPDSTGSITDATIAGKNVLALTEGENTQYAYPSGDVFFIVGGENELVEATLSLLP